MPSTRVPGLRSSAIALVGPALMGADAAGTGPWIFGSVALLAVAALAYALGRAHRAPGSAPAGDAPVNAAHAGASDGASPLGALAQVAGDRLQVFYRAAGGGAAWQRVGAEANSGAAPAASAPSPTLSPPDFDPGCAAAVNLSPGQQATAAGWRMQCWLMDGQEMLLVWRTDEPATPASTSQDLQALTYSVSHDLRAPVRVVDGFARILKEDYGRHLDRIGNDHLDRVLAASARMNGMIEGVLALARISEQPLSRQPVNLSRVAAFVVEELKRAAPQRNVGVEIEDGLEVMADPTLMRQVMDNLLSNAWKYTARSDPALISVRATTDADGRRVIEVGDNGAGFDMRSADRLFGLFQRLHAAHDYPGTGVGLASVQRIVRRHGGEIWADSAPGQGAKFRFTLG